MVTLTDEDNPFFLHAAEISDEDYQLLRAQQNLLVDFTQFPYKVVELFDACVKESREPNPKYDVYRLIASSFTHSFYW